MIFCTSCSCVLSKTSRRFRSSRSCVTRRRLQPCSCWWYPASWCVGLPTPSCPWWRHLGGRPWSLQQWPSSPHSLPSPARRTTPWSTYLWVERFVIKDVSYVSEITPVDIACFSQKIRSGFHKHLFLVSAYSDGESFMFIVLWISLFLCLWRLISTILDYIIYRECSHIQIDVAKSSFFH